MASRNSRRSSAILIALTDAPNGKELWAESYDRQYTAANLFEVQGDIARQVAAFGQHGDVLVAKGHIVVFDMAYQGFGTGLDEDAGGGDDPAAPTTTAPDIPGCHVHTYG